MINQFLFLCRPTRLCVFPALALLMVFPTVCEAQICSQTDIELSNQAAVDTFQSDYGPCDQVAGSLRISGLILGGSDISSLSPLDDITHIGGSLEFYRLSLLTGIDGLTSLQDVGGTVFFYASSFVTHVDGLANLQMIGGDLNFFQQNELTDITGLSNLEFIGGGLLIEGMRKLDSLAPFQALTQIQGAISISATAITNLHGLENVDAIPDVFNLIANLELTSLNGFPAAATEVGGDMWIYRNHKLKDLAEISGLTWVSGSLRVQENFGLKELTGLDNIEAVEGVVYIYDNPNLLDCLAVVRLLDDVDDGISGPGPEGSEIPDVGQLVLLQNNRPLCNSTDLMDDLIFWDGAEGDL